jgi:hypothetical protein
MTRLNIALFVMKRRAEMFNILEKIIVGVIVLGLTACIMLFISLFAGIIAAIIGVLALFVILYAVGSIILR